MKKLSLFLVFALNQGLFSQVNYKEIDRMVGEQKESFHHEVRNWRIDLHNNPNYQHRTIDITVPPVPLGTVESYANGKVKGKWVLNNVTDDYAGHRTDLSAYNPSNNKAYTLTATRLLMQGELKPEGELVIKNHNVRIDGNVFLCAQINGGNSRLIGGASTNNTATNLRYSDDEGLTWKNSNGGDYEKSDASLFGTILNNSKKTVLALVWKNYGYTLLKSNDNGVNYTEVKTWSYNNLQNMAACPILNTNDCYLIGKVKGANSYELYKFDGTNETITLLSTKSLNNNNVTSIKGVFLNGKVHLYVAITGGDIYYSSDTGSTWNLKGNKGEWDTLSSVSPYNEKELMFNSTQGWFSLDGGVTSELPSWWQETINWDTKSITWYKKSDGTWFCIRNNDFGLYFASQAHTQASWKQMNNKGMHQILHDGEYYEDTKLCLTGNQDRGTMIWDKEVTPNNFSGKAIRNADGIRIKIANYGKSFWYMHYWGTLYHQDVATNRNAEINAFTNKNWYTPPMSPSWKTNEDAIYMAGENNLNKFTYNATNNTVSKTVLPFDFKAASGEIVYGVGTTKADANRVYAISKNGQFYYSTNAGSTFTKTTFTGAMPEVDGFRTWGVVGFAIEVSQNDPNLVYLAGLGNNTNAIMVSKDGGKTFNYILDGIGRTDFRDLELSKDDKFLFSSNMQVYVVDEKKWYDMSGGSAPFVENVSSISYIPSKKTVRYFTWGYGMLDFVMDPATLDSTKFELANQLVEIYPNPFSNDLTIKLNGEFKYTLFDVFGKLIEDGEGNNQKQIGSKLSNGFYLIKLDKGGDSKTMKILKK
jgi:hypothetical protein